MLLHLLGTAGSLYRGSRDPTKQPDDGALFASFVRSHPRSARGLSDARGVAATRRHRVRTAASRQDAQTYFLDAIQHYVYAGDTGLHVAAAAYQRTTVETLVAIGARVPTRNRRGAEPLHSQLTGTQPGRTGTRRHSIRSSSTWLPAGRIPMRATTVASLRSIERFAHDAPWQFVPSSRTARTRN